MPVQNLHVKTRKFCELLFDETFNASGTVQRRIPDFRREICGGNMSWNLSFIEADGGDGDGDGESHCPCSQRKVDENDDP